jgi:c-di-GMP-binding flagellar brake protein YcgR
MSMIDGESLENEPAIQDRVLVEAEIQGRPVSFRAVMVRVCETELWLGLASPDRRLETIHPNQAVRLTIARSGAALLGRSEYLRSLGGNKSRVFAVDRPALLERVQRRGYVRYPIDLPIRVRHLDPATWEPLGKTATTMTKNLSPGGLLFVSDATVSVGDDLDLILPLSGGDRVSMSGVVKRLGRGFNDGESEANGQPDHSEVAVKFTRITTLDQDRIVRLILLTEHRRREAALREPRLPAVEPPAATLTH